MGLLYFICSLGHLCLSFGCLNILPHFLRNFSSYLMSHLAFISLYVLDKGGHVVEQNLFFFFLTYLLVWILFLVQSFQVALIADGIIATNKVIAWFCIAVLNSIASVNFFHQVIVVAKSVSHFLSLVKGKGLCQIKTHFFMLTYQNFTYIFKMFYSSQDYWRVELITAFLSRLMNVLECLEGLRSYAESSHPVIASISYKGTETKICSFHVVAFRVG